MTTDDTKHSTIRKPELLAPAGSFEAFRGAVAAGADAVYLGGERFGARAYAQNFTEEEIIEAIAFAHIFGARVYLTVNTLTRQSELDNLTEYVERLYRAGLDGVIVQDIGVLKRLGRRCPDLRLHASTQMSVTGPGSVRLLQNLGVSRVVPARELSLEEMRAIKEETGIEIEAFIHGAMCYSYSGRCLMSSFLGGRSGNRGRCAGTCRLPYRISFPESGKAEEFPGGRKDFYPLSMRDMCALEKLPSLIEAGIDSFKIEGRMKKAEYAAGVTAVYRKYIDLYFKLRSEGAEDTWKVEKEDLHSLTSLYIRSQLSGGYYNIRNSKDLLTLDSPGYAGADDILLNKIREKYIDHPVLKPVRGKAFVAAPDNIRLEVFSADGISASVSGDAAQPAKSRPLTEEDIRQKLTQTKDTAFVFERLDVETDGASFVPVSALKELRRKALSELTLRYSGVRTPSLEGSRQEDIGDAWQAARRKSRHTASPGRSVWVLASTKQQLQSIAAVINKESSPGSSPSGSARVNVGAVIVPPELGAEAGKVLSSRIPFMLSLPHMVRRPEYSALEAALENGSFSGFYVRTMEELDILKKKYYYREIAAAFSLYAWNTESAEWLFETCDYFTLPPELSGKEAASVFGPALKERAILEVYGKTPLMVTAGCLRKTSGRCTKADNGFLYLTDRKNARFPVRTDCAFCHNVIFNSVPTSLHRQTRDPAFQGAPVHLLSFTDEDGRKAGEILDAYLQLENITETPGGSTAAAVKDRIDELLRTDTSSQSAGYTAGHFNKGAL